MKLICVCLELLFSSSCIGTAGPADDSLKAFIETIRRSDVTYESARTARDQLKASYPNAEQANLAEAAYLDYLSDAPGLTRIDEMAASFQALRQKGESQYYVATARLSLMSAYSQNDRNADAKLLAQEALQKIDPVALKGSYNALIQMLRFACGDDQFTDADTDIGALMTAFQSVANG